MFICQEVWTGLHWVFCTYEVKVFVMRLSSHNAYLPGSLRFKVDSFDKFTLSTYVDFVAADLEIISTDTFRRAVKMPVAWSKAVAARSEPWASTPKPVSYAFNFRRPAILPSSCQSFLLLSWLRTYTAKSQLARMSRAASVSLLPTRR